MGLFEFLMILVSVIIGLAISEILSGVASLLRARESVRTYWIHILFQLGVFLALVQQWWESWSLVDVQTISLSEIVLFISQPVVLYLIAHLLYPRPVAGADLDQYYYEQAPVLWSLVVFGTIIGTFVLPLFRNEPLFLASNLSGIPMIVAGLTLAISRNRTVHSIIAPAIVLMLTLDIWLVNPAISSP